MDRRTLLAITLCFLIYMGWQKFYLEPRLPHQPTNISQLSQQPTSQSAAAPEQSATTPVPAHKRPIQTVQIETPTGPAWLGDGPKVLADWKLAGYHTGLSDSTPAIDLPSVTHRDEGEISFHFDDPHYSYLDNVQGALKKTPAGVEWVYEDQNVKLTRLVSAADGQKYLNLDMTAQFKRRAPQYAFVSLNLPYVKGDSDERDRELVYWSGNSISRINPKKATKDESSSPASYIGAQSRYFVLAVLNNSPLQPRAVVQPLGNEDARVMLIYPVSGSRFSMPLKVFFGPKELNLLRSVDPLLDHIVNFGWFTVFAFPLLKFMKFIYGFVGNYGIAIIILTILLRLLTYPLTYKSMKSMKQMAKIQPQLAKIREKYKNDKESLNREMLGLMKNHGYNPAAGCLPMIIQIPIFFALDRVLYSSVDLYHAPFAFYLHDLSAKDPYYITPVLLSVFMWLQQKISPTNATMDPSQAKMMQFMPLMFGAFMLNLPSGLNLYILISTIVGIAQQLVLNKKFNLRGPGNNPGSAPAPALVARNP